MFTAMVNALSENDHPIFSLEERTMFCIGATQVTLLVTGMLLFIVGGVWLGYGNMAQMMTAKKLLWAGGALFIALFAIECAANAYVYGKQAERLSNLYGRETI